MKNLSYEAGELITSNNSTFRIVEATTICPCIECYAYDHESNLCICCTMCIIPSNCCFKLEKDQKGVKILKPGQLLSYKNHTYRVKRTKNDGVTCKFCAFRMMHPDYCKMCCDDSELDFKITDDCYLELVK